MYGLLATKSNQILYMIKKDFDKGGSWSGYWA